MEKQAHLRRALEADMRTALGEGGFELHYQPLVDLRSDEVTGCEALLRWRHPMRGMISPAEFIPVAEETGLIEEIGQWVLRTACIEAANWPAHVRVAVNVSPVQFKSETLALKVASALAESGLDPRRLELEITEAVLIADDDAALVTLGQLRTLGVHIALDDFGTGYSSLQYLQRFPFDKIKIDRSFVKEVTRNYGLGVDHPRRGLDRGRPQHDHDRRGRRDRSAARHRADARLHADAGLSVQQAGSGAGRPDCCWRPMASRTPPERAASGSSGRLERSAAVPELRSKRSPALRRSRRTGETDAPTRRFPCGVLDRGRRSPR